MLEPIYLFTVFTATCNQSKTLPRVYESLCAQTCRNFEWLIVDDGSNDGTEGLVQNWQREAEFPIRYIWQENQGKYVAFNRGVEQAKGALFLTLDSDDACIRTALERLAYHWHQIPSEARDQYCSVSVLCRDEQGDLIGEPFPNDVIDTSLPDMIYKYHLNGAKWHFTRTDLLRQFPFPKIEGERFIPAGVVWNAVGREYKSRFVNETLRIYYRRNEAQPDRIMATNSPSRHALGLAFWHETILNNDIAWFRYAPQKFLRSGVHYSRFSFHAGLGIGGQLRRLDNVFARLLWAAMWPVGYLVYRNEHFFAR
jgi:glycosyltransferase involved in cell wall biosynthesis